MPLVIFMLTVVIQQFIVVHCELFTFMHLFWVVSEYLLHTIWEQCFEIWFYVMNDSSNFFECCTCMDTWMLCEIYCYYFLVKFRLGLQFCVIKQVLRWSRSIVFQQFIEVNTVAFDFEGTNFSVVYMKVQVSDCVITVCLTGVTDAKDIMYQCFWQYHTSYRSLKGL